jgi:hypothetical protein
VYGSKSTTYPKNSRKRKRPWKPDGQRKEPDAEKKDAKEAPGNRGGPPGHGKKSDRGQTGNKNAFNKKSK